ATPSALRPTGPVTRVRGPLAGHGEELAVYRPEDVADELADIGATPRQTAHILALPAFGWLDDDGTAVFAFFPARLTELTRLGVLGTVVDHERRHVSGGFVDDQAHRDDLGAVLAEIQVAGLEQNLRGRTRPRSRAALAAALPRVGSRAPPPHRPVPR